MVELSSFVTFTVAYLTPNFSISFRYVYGGQHVQLKIATGVGSNQDKTLAFGMSNQPV